MKKIILFFFLSCYVNAQDYSTLFNSLDSLQKKEVFFHSRKINQLINYEIIKSGYKIRKNDHIKGTLFIDNNGKINLTMVDGKSKKHEKIIVSTINNLPIAFCKKYYNEHFSFSFKLIEIDNLENHFEKLIKKEENQPSSFKELSTYPSFENSNHNNDNAKVLEEFKKGIANHIKANIKYPAQELKKGNQGKTNVWFIISKDGEITEIVACNANPNFQMEGIRIIECLPKINPGKIDDKPVKILYAQPVTFKLQ